jgi:capsular exopolysaccharide synthesis family protein
VDGDRLPGADCADGHIGTLKQRPVYHAVAVLQIDRDAPNVLSFQEFVAEVAPYDDSYLETAFQVLQSRTLARRVIDKLHLDQSPEFEEVLAEKPSWLAQLWQESGLNSFTAAEEDPGLDPKDNDLIEAFQERLSVTPVRNSALVEISFEAYEPELAARVVNALAANFIDQNLEAKWDASQKASDWLSQQLVGLKAKLESSEEELQRYAKNNSILFLDERQSMNSEKLQQLQAEATRAEADLIQKESLYNQVRGGDLSSVPGILEHKLYQDLSVRLADLRREHSELLATFTPEYPRVKRLKSQIDELEGAVERERGAFAKRVADDYHAAVNRKRLLDQAVLLQTQEFNDMAEKSIQYNILRREAETNKQLYDGLLQRMKEASLSAGLTASNVRVVDQADLPVEPASPQPLINLALGFLAGLGLGVGMAFFQEYLDNTLKTPEDVQRFLHLPALGVIPASNTNGKAKLPYGYGYGYGMQKPLLEAGSADNGGKGHHSELMAAQGNSPLSEAYRSLRTSVLLSTSGRPPRIILVTSGHPGEGKTTTVVNLSTALTQLGSRVLTVDSDMRRPRVGTLLKLPSSPAGLSTLLTGQFSLDEVVMSTQVPNLFAIPCGPIPPNPAELLASDSMQRFIEEAAQKFDYVVLDSPPVLHVTDARILAPQAEVVVLVAHGGVTPHEAVKHARDHLRQANANLIGLVLNNVDFSSVGYDYYYRYNRRGYGYGGYGYGKYGYGGYGSSSHENRESAPGS